MLNRLTRWCAAWGLCLWSCLPKETVPLDIDPSQIGVVVTTQAGQPAAVGTIESGVSVASDDDSRTFLFTMPRSAFARADGAEVDFRGLRANFAEERTGLCMRCIAPAGQKIQAVFSGDSCPLPTFAEAQALVDDVLVPLEDAQLAEQLAQLVYLDWPGECNHPLGPEASERKQDYTFYPIGEDAWPIEAAAIAKDGSVGLFHERVAILIDAAGSQTLLPLDGVVRGPVLSAVAIDDEGEAAYLLAATTLELAVHEMEYFRVETQPPSVRPQSFTREITPGHFVSTSTTDQTFWMMGGEHQVTRSFNAEIDECEVIGDRITCRELTSNSINCGSKQTIVSVARLDDQRMFGVLREDALVFMEKVNGTWSIECQEAIPTRNETLSNKILSDAFAFPNGRGYFCTETNYDVLTADLSNAQTLPEMLAAEWTSNATAADAGNGRCSFLPGPNPDEVTLVPEIGVQTICNDRGDCRPGDRVLTEHGLQRVVRTGPDRYLGYTFKAGQDRHPAIVYRKLGDQPFERVYGQRERRPFPIRALLYDPILGLVRPRDTFFEVFERSGLEVTSTIFPVEDAVDGFVEEATFNSLDGTVVALVFLVDGPGALYGIDLHESSPAWRELARLPGFETCLPSLTIRNGLVEVQPGEFLVTSPCGRIVRFDGEQVFEIEIEWDDPYTDVREREPQGRFSTIGVSASGGIGWVVGNETTVLRVFGDRAVRFAPEAQDVPPTFSEALLTVTKAFGPDRFIAADGRVFFGTAAGDNIRDVTFRPIPIAAGVQIVRSLFRSSPTLILGESMEEMIIFSGNAVTHQLPVGRSETPGRSLITPTSGAMEPSGVVWLGGPDDRMVLGVPQ